MKYKGVARTIGENEQRIKEKSSNSYKWTNDKKKWATSVIVENVQRTKRRTITAATNEQMIEKKSSLFQKKE